MSSEDPERGYAASNGHCHSFLEDTALCTGKGNTPSTMLTQLYWKVASLTRVDTFEGCHAVPCISGRIKPFSTSRHRTGWPVALHGAGLAADVGALHSWVQQVIGGHQRYD